MTATAAPRTKRQKKEAKGPYGVVGSTVEALDERLGIAKGGRTFMDKIFPDHWSLMLGEIALYSFVVLLLTGVFLTLYFVPSQHLMKVPMDFPYKPLRGDTVSEAFYSTVNMSFNVRCGLLMRQMHHWACDIFVGAIVVHMARVFFTGAFRKPREANWLVGSTLLILAITNGFLGYSLPDDLVSGTGIRIADSIMLSVPVVGSYLSFFVFGGTFPGDIVIERFFIIHVLLVPGIIMALVGAHLGLLVRQKHTQFPGKGRTEGNVVGSPMFPVFIFKTQGFLFMTLGVTALLGALAQINPVWQFGQYYAAQISYAVQPDWYMGFLDGLLRIFPAWEWNAWGHTIPLEVTIPAVIFPGIVFNIAMAWPWIEQKFTKDKEIHHLLDRPRDVPHRTAFGVAFFSLLAILFIASSTDVLANFFHVSLNTVLIIMRVLTFLVPIIAYPVAYFICVELQRGGSIMGKRKIPNVVVRTTEGEYIATPSAPRPGDAHVELDATPVPTFIIEGEADESDVTDLEDVEVDEGVRTTSR
ncbi:MAG: ubiquinol-cytochrome c reductase cytochrome b subunit [Actinomycetota bacterium]